MQDMTTNNNVEKVIFISTRWIPQMSIWKKGQEKEDYAKCEEYLVFSRSMTEYFYGLNDDCSRFLKSTVETGNLVTDVINNFLKKIQEMGISDYEIIISQNNGRAPQIIKLCDILKPDFNYKEYTRQRTKIINSNILNESFGEQIKVILPKIDSQNAGEGDINSFDDEEILNRSFQNDKKDISHLDIPIGVKTIKKRVGLYKKEEDNYGLCAIWPWSGEYEKYNNDTNHDKEWGKTICKSILEFYPNAKEAILILHDRDFQEYEKTGKDEVIGWNCDDNNKLHYCLVVFRHNNIDIQNIIQFNNEIKKMYDIAYNHANGYVDAQKADTLNKNAEAHKSAIKNQEKV